MFYFIFYSNLVITIPAFVSVTSFEVELKSPIVPPVVNLINAVFDTLAGVDASFTVSTTFAVPFVYSDNAIGLALSAEYVTRYKPAGTVN